MFHARDESMLYLLNCYVAKWYVLLIANAQKIAENLRQILKLVTRNCQSKWIENLKRN